MDVVFVAAPYHAVERPSLAIGILQAQLRRAGVSTHAEYSQLRFAEALGLDAYVQLESIFSGNQIGELTFARAAFREAAPDARAKVRDIARGLARVMGGWVITGLPKLFRAAETAALDFVDETAARIVAQRPKLVGCSSTFEQHVASLAILRRVKELAPEIVTVMGGPNCEGPMGQATVDAFPWLDHVVSGEADHLVLELWQLVAEFGSSIPAARLPYGVLTRRGVTRLTLAGDIPRVIVHDLDAIAMPDFADYFEQLRVSPLAERIQPALVVETSRGCWYGQKHHCTFCGQNGMGLVYRSKSPERARAEFRTLADRYDCPNFGVVDNILDHSYFREVFPALAADERDYRIFYEVKSTLKRAQLEALRDAGVRAFLPGIETLDDELSDLMTKGNDAYRSVQLLKWARELALYVHWILLVNIPGEQELPYRRMAALIPKITHLQPPNSTTPVQFHRFSPYVEDAARFGLELVPLDAYRFIYPVEEGRRRDLAYYFENTSDRTWTLASAAHEAFSRCLQQWVTAYNAGARLEWRGDEVFDARDPEHPRSVPVSAHARQVCELLDAAASHGDLRQRALQAGLDATQLASALDELESHGFVLRDAKKCVGLVTRPGPAVDWISFKAPHGVILPEEMSTAGGGTLVGVGAAHG